MKIQNQRLRNLTTGRLHTEMGHIYEDLGALTGETGLMTHMLPRALRACQPWLREHVTDPRFWDDEDRQVMFERYAAQPNPLAGKEVIGVFVERQS